MTRIDVLDAAGELAGVFLTPRPTSDALGLPLPAFLDWEGEWWPAGGCSWTASEWPLRASGYEVVGQPGG